MLGRGLTGHTSGNFQKTLFVDGATYTVDCLWLWGLHIPVQLTANEEQSGGRNGMDLYRLLSWLIFPKLYSIAAVSQP